MYKCAIIGVGGGRARGHADAYEHIKRGELVAVSTRRQDKLDAFGDSYEVDARYRAYRELFEKERPDLVHVNMPPNVRLEIFEAADEAGIPALIVEKPLAIQGEDYQAIRSFAARSRVKIAVNHQLHFHPRRVALQNLVRDGKIGEVRFIDASACLNLAYQGTHVLQSISAFNPSGNPLSVFGQVSGAAGLIDDPKQHVAPDQSLAGITYDNGVRAQLHCGPDAPLISEEKPSHSKRIAIYGSRGYVFWTMSSWQTNCDGRVDSGAHEYYGEDVLSQAAMTEAMFDWLEDDNAIHPLNLSTSLRDFNLILGLYMSALQHKVISLPVEPEPNLIESLRSRLG